MDILSDHNSASSTAGSPMAGCRRAPSPPNRKLAEVRWAWQVSQAWQLHVRLRRREEIDLSATAAGARRDDDLYVRATLRF